MTALHSRLERPTCKFGLKSFRQISNISQGQRASVKAESGGFNILNAKVRSIIGEVSERDLFAINGSNDINARVILVKLDLDPDDRPKVQQLSD